MSGYRTVAVSPTAAPGDLLCIGRGIVTRDLPRQGRSVAVGFKM